MKNLPLATALCLLLISCDTTQFIEIKNTDGEITESFYQKEDGTLHGLKSTYLDNKLYSEETFVDGKMNGIRKIFYGTGEVEIEENYTNDVLTGLVKTFYPSGVLKQEASYKDGVLEGMIKSFYDSGKIKEEVTFVNNEENGPFKEFHENGQLSWEGNYINGDNEIGVISNYDEAGTLIKKMQCDTFMGFSKCKTIWPEGISDSNE
jgi:antitoxin component YwqK of YwqJK toxin-antitoxin module